MLNVAHVHDENVLPFRYHHTTVLLYAWFSYTETTASARWFIVMNYCVHSVMYSYYALKSMGYRPSKYIQVSIAVITATTLAPVLNETCFALHF